jgi:hypothetical protein
MESSQKRKVVRGIDGKSYSSLLTLLKNLTDMRQKKKSSNSLLQSTIVGWTPVKTKGTFKAKRRAPQILHVSSRSNKFLMMIDIVKVPSSFLLSTLNSSLDILGEVYKSDENFLVCSSSREYDMVSKLCKIATLSEEDIQILQVIRKVVKQDFENQNDNKFQHIRVFVQLYTKLLAMMLLNVYENRDEVMQKSVLQAIQFEKVQEDSRSLDELRKELLTEIREAITERLEAIRINQRELKKAYLELNFEFIEEDEDSN